MSTPPPTESFFPGLKFNNSFFTSGNEAATIDYCNQNFLRSSGYAVSRAIWTTFNNIVYFNGGFEVVGNITVNGDVSANNFKGSGAQLTSINASNVSTGTLSIVRGGTGLTTFNPNFILYGSSSNTITSSTNFIYDPSTLTLKSQRLTGALQIATGSEHIGATGYFISTTGTDSSAVKTVYTINGAYVLSVSSLAATGSKIELIFDNNNLTNWITLNSTYTKENGLTTGRYLANTTGTINVNYFTTSVSVIGTIYGEWVQVQFPKRVAINDVLFIPESLPRAIIKGYLLGSNNGITWEVVYGEFTLTTWANFVERSLLGVYTQNTKQYLRYRLVATQIQGVTSGASGATEKFSIAGLRFTFNQNVNYIDSVLCLGDPVGTGDPMANVILDVNGGVNINGRLLINGTAISSGQWITSGSNIYYNTGNVGIGNTNPTGTLCLGNSSIGGSDGFLLIGKNNGAGGARTQRIGYNSDFGLAIGDYGGGTGPWIEAFKLSYAAPANSLVIDGGGKVGIGHPSPSYKCHIKCSYNDVGTGLHLDAGEVTSEPNKYSLTIWPYVIAGGEVGWKFRTQNYTGGTHDAITIKNYGQVSIGSNCSANSFTAGSTIQAYGPFYFPNDAWNNSNDGYNRLYFATNGTTYIKSGANMFSGNYLISFRGNNDVDYAFIEQAGVFRCYGPVSLSDRRIKRDIEEINDDDALNKILLVQPTTYYYRDESRNKGNGKVYGFIAQQIKEVIPDAVHTTKDIIANIYKTCLVYNKREIYHSIPQDVAIDTEVQIYEAEGVGGKRYKIKAIYQDHFKIDEDIESESCFVFGYCVYDLNALDKSYIFTLNVCATQELHRRMEAQEKRIKDLEEKIERLLTIIDNN
jgi:hypothetical protein